jgi:hypothetical protein
MYEKHRASVAELVQLSIFQQVAFIRALTLYTLVDRLCAAFAWSFLNYLQFRQAHSSATLEPGVTLLLI